MHNSVNIGQIPLLQPGQRAGLQPGFEAKKNCRPGYTLLLYLRLCSVGQFDVGVGY